MVTSAEGPAGIRNDDGSPRADHAGVLDKAMETVPSIHSTFHFTREAAPGEMVPRHSRRRRSFGFPAGFRRHLRPDARMATVNDAPYTPLT